MTPESGISGLGLLHGIHDSVTGLCRRLALAFGFWLESRPGREASLCLTEQTDPLASLQCPCRTGRWYGAPPEAGRYVRAAGRGGVQVPSGESSALSRVLLVGTRPCRDGMGCAGASGQKLHEPGALRDWLWRAVGSAVIVEGVPTIFPIWPMHFPRRGRKAQPEVAPRHPNLAVAVVKCIAGSSTT